MRSFIIAALAVTTMAALENEKTLIDAAEITGPDSKKANFTLKSGWVKGGGSDPTLNFKLDWTVVRVKADENDEDDWPWKNDDAKWTMEARAAADSATMEQTEFSFKAAGNGSKLLSMKYGDVSTAEDAAAPSLSEYLGAISTSALVVSGAAAP